MNVVIITQNEPFYIPKMIDVLIKNMGENYTITGVTILNPHRKNKNMIHWVKERLTVYSYWEMLLAAFAFFWCILNKKIYKTNSHYSVESIVVKNKLKLIESNDINSQEYIAALKQMETDIVISISCPQLFESGILGAAKIACVNAHGTLLPRHRGVFGSWWTLFKNDKEGGSTIHTMELKLDAGEIVWQKSFHVENDDTQFSIAYKTKRDMAFGLVEVLKMYKSGNKTVILPKYESSYHRAPSKELGNEFHGMGKRVITLIDLGLMFSKSF